MSETNSTSESGLDGATAIVTGGAGGIGATLSIELAKEGANVVVAQRSKERPQAVVERIEELGGNAMFVQTDLADPEDITELVDETIERYGGVNILVNNAAHTSKEWAAEISRDLWEEMIAVTLTAPFFLAQACRESMLGQGFGRIINIGAIQAYSPLKGSVAYASAKAGLEGLTRSMAVEWSDTTEADLTANTVHVGPIFSDKDNWKESDDPIEVADTKIETDSEPLTLVGRWGEPNDIAKIVRYLASPASSFVTGQVFTCDGGRLISRKPGSDSQM